MSEGQISLFYSVLNKREKLARIQHHVKVYERTLETRVILRGLRLKKKACLGVLSVKFKERWDKILVEAELNLVRLLLYAEAIAWEKSLVVEYDRIWKQIEKEIGSKTVRGWSLEIEEKAENLERELAEKRFRKWTIEAEGVKTYGVRSGDMILERIQLNRRASLETVNEHHNTFAGDEVDQDCIIKELGARNQQRGEISTAEVFPQEIVENRGVLIKGSGEDIDKCNQGRGFVSENVVFLSNRELTS